MQDEERGGKIRVMGGGKAWITEAAKKGWVFCEGAGTGRAESGGRTGGEDGGAAKGGGRRRGGWVKVLDTVLRGGWYMSEKSSGSKCVCVLCVCTHTHTHTHTRIGICRVRHQGQCCTLSATRIEVAHSSL